MIFINFNKIVIDPGHGGIDIGYDNGIKKEKDFNLDLGRKIYNRLFDLGYLTLLTRSGDETISNDERYSIINNAIVDDNNGLVVSIQVDDEKKDGISIISSINSQINDLDVFETLFEDGEVVNKTLPVDNNKDYYAIQRVSPVNSEVLVIEFGNNYLNASKNDIEQIADKIVDGIIEVINYNKGYVSYIVKKGDNLYNLAKKYNTTVTKLKKINNLETDALTVGQILMVPQHNNNVYIVKRGDSLYSIAKKFDVSVDEIKKINNLQSDKLMIDQRLIIPI